MLQQLPAMLLRMLRRHALFPSIVRGATLHTLSSSARALQVQPYRLLAYALIVSSLIPMVRCVVDHVSESPVCIFQQLVIPTSPLSGEPISRSRWIRGTRR